MAYTIDKIDIWVGSIQDKPGGVAAKLEPIAAAGAALEFALARRDKRGKGLVFVAPLKGPAIKAAKNAGLAKSDDIQALRIKGPDKAGLGALIAKTLGDAEVNMRGLSAAAVGRECICYLAFDNKEDAAKARRLLTRAL